MVVSRRGRAVVIVAIVAYLGVGVLPYLGSALVVPLGTVPVLWGAWVAGLVVCVRLIRAHSMWSLAAAPLALLFWVVFVQTGSLLFDWTA
ncbi:MAG: hypothetical protein OES13_05750 [Acidimicrobiia bacterium]|nr:hypothetical protein [Acidimicrobiia bacterium]